MKYKVVVTVLDKKLKVHMCNTKQDAIDKLMEVVSTMVGEYVIGGQNIDQVTDTITIPLLKDNKSVGSIIGAPATATARPLTGKFKRIKLLMSKVTPAFLASEVTGLLKEVLTGNYPMDAPIAPGLTVGDVLKVNGFFTDATLIEHMCSMYTGRMFRQLATQEGINMNDPAEVTKMIPVIDFSQRLEKAAVPIVINNLTRSQGIPTALDQEAIKGLVDKLLAALAEVSS